MSDRISNCWLTVGALLAGLAVVTGAFAAHGLDGYLLERFAGQSRVVAGDEMPLARKYLADFKTAAEYQMYHALGLIAVGVLASRRRSRALSCAGWSLLSGIVLFSGSLYVLTLTGVSKLGMITPVGGVLFIVGWFALAVAAFPGQGQDMVSERKE